jgi:Flp pilus assembly CpaE family ATPase
VDLNNITALAVSPNARWLDDVTAALAAEGVACLQATSYSMESQPTVDVVLVDFDENREAALRLVGSSGLGGHTRLVACSSTSEPQIVVEAMRVGARAKGGVGTTTLAANFAIALREESGQPVALADMNFYLGDITTTLGMEQKFGLRDAVDSLDRLDGDFLDALMTQHPSGVSVLAGPDQLHNGQPVGNAQVRSLIKLMRKRFRYVVLDAGPASTQAMQSAFELANRIFLVACGDVPTIRNARRFIEQIHTMNGHGPRIDVLLNRVRSREQIDEAQVAKTLGVPVSWRVPNDYSRVRAALNRGVALAETGSPVVRTLHAMARDACGKPKPKSFDPWSIFRGAKVTVRRNDG